MEEFDEDRCCKVCTWTGDSRKQLMKHTYYMHSEVFRCNLSPDEYGYRYLAEDSGVPRCELCSIFVGTEFAREHPRNAYHQHNLARHQYLLEEESGLLPPSNESNETDHVNDEENYFDPEGADSFGCSNASDSGEDGARSNDLEDAEAYDGGAASDGGEDGVEAYEDACDFLEDRYNMFTCDDWRTGSSRQNLSGENAAAIQDSTSNLRASLPLDFLGQEQNLPYEKEHVGETFLSCVEVTVDGVSSLDLNTRANLEERAYDWRTWKTICVVDTSVSSEV